MKAYLANGLFSEADREFNAQLAWDLRFDNSKLGIYVPQENTEINDKSIVVTSQEIAHSDVKHLLESDILIAVLDGVEIDSGVAAEIGAFYMMGKPIYALCTDIRLNPSDKTDMFESPTLYRNLFVVGLIKNSGGAIYNNTSDLRDKIKSLGEHNG